MQQVNTACVDREYMIFGAGGGVNQSLYRYCGPCSQRRINDIVIGSGNEWTKAQLREQAMDFANDLVEHLVLYF